MHSLYAKSWCDRLGCPGRSQQHGAQRAAPGSSDTNNASNRLQRLFDLLLLDWPTEGALAGQGHGVDQGKWPADSRGCRVLRRALLACFFSSWEQQDVRAAVQVSAGGILLNVYRSTPRTELARDVDTATECPAGLSIPCLTRAPSGEIGRCCCSSSAVGNRRRRTVVRQHARYSSVSRAISRKSAHRYRGTGR